MKWPWVRRRDVLDADQRVIVGVAGDHVEIELHVHAGNTRANAVALLSIERVEELHAALDKAVREARLNALAERNARVNSLLAWYVDGLAGRR